MSTSTMITKSQKRQDSGKVKTSIDLPADLSEQLTIKTIKEFGGRHRNAVIEELIRMYVNGKIRLKQTG